MNPVLDVVKPQKHDGHLQIWVILRIYHRKNETFFVIKSFIWRRFAMITMLFCWLFSFEIHSCSSQISLFRLYSFGQSLNFKSKIIFNFRLLFTHVWHLHGIELCQSHFFNFWFNTSFSSVSNFDKYKFK